MIIVAWELCGKALRSQPRIEEGRSESGRANSINIFSYSPDPNSEHGSRLEHSVSVRRLPSTAGKRSSLSSPLRRDARHAETVMVDGDPVGHVHVRAEMHVPRCRPVAAAESPPNDHCDSSKRNPCKRTGMGGLTAEGPPSVPRDVGNSH